MEGGERNGRGRRERGNLPCSVSLTAVILAGGVVTRLRGVVRDRPKVLAPVGGRPFLAYLLDQLEAAGVRKVVLCTGYLGEQIRQELGHAYGNLALAYSQESEPLGTAGALRLAPSRIDDELWLVMNGDSYVDADLNEFLAWHQEHQYAGSILLTWVENAARYGTVDVDAEGAIRAFHEKQGRAVPGWINAGLYLLSRRLVESLPLGRVLSMEREVFPEWVSLGLGGFCTRATFIDIGTPESFAEAETLLTGISASR